jgi:ATP-dependent RNA helicase RhlE
VNFELPWNPQDYIHRIGRTGRAGQTGDAISLVCIDETDLLRGVQRLLKKAIPWTVEDGFIPDRNTPPRPLRGGPEVGAGRGGGRHAPRTLHHAHRKPVRRSAEATRG